MPDSPERRKPLDPVAFRRCRNRAKLRQVDVAEALSVGQATISTWERGTPTLIHPRLIDALAELLGVTAEDLVIKPRRRKRVAA